MRIRAAFFLLLAAGLIAGCGGGGSQSTALPPPPSVSISFNVTPVTSLAVNATYTLGAIVNNGSSALVNWSVTCGSAGACGSFNPIQTSSGASTAYTAPSAIPTGSTVTITATSVADSTKSVLATITISAHPPISISFAPPSSLHVNDTVSFSATISNDFSANPQVMWTVTCGDSACGSFNPTTTASGVATTFIAPSTTPPVVTAYGESGVYVTATSVADSTVSVTYFIAITASSTTDLVFAPQPPTSMAGNTFVYINAQGANDTFVPIQWSVTCDSAACGSFIPTTATAPEDESAYFAPSAIPTGNTVTVTATSISNPSVSVSATITITTPVATLANGTYVFQVSDHISSVTPGPANFRTGAFVANNGVITGGEFDYAFYSSFQDSNGDYTYYPSLGLTTISGGWYAPAQNGVIEIQFNGDGGYSIYLAPNANGVPTQYCDITRTTTCATILQSTNSTSLGSYLVTLGGGDSIGDPASASGPFDLEGPSVASGTQTQLEITDNLSTQQISGIATIGSPDPFGRVTIDFFSNQDLTTPELSLSGYVVDKNNILLVETQGDGFGGVLGGSAVKP